MASSGRYTHLDGKMHRRVPFGCYKIGLVASGELHKFVTNEVATDPLVHDHDWARRLGLVSFAGFRLLSTAGQPIGVLALFRTKPISADEVSLLEGLANSTSQVILTAAAEEERKSLQAQLQHAQTLESLGVLAGGIAHDFNNLLLGVLGNADLALAKLPPTSPAHTKVMDIQRAARRAAELSNQMLVYSGKSRLLVEAVDLSSVVGEMARLLKTSISKKVELRYELADDLPAIEADATQVRQVVMNLITNAAEAVAEQPATISVTTGARECDREFLEQTYVDDNLSEGTYVSLEVADTGYGMESETRRRMFDPFFTTKATGRGLGLAVLFGIVRGHRGAIEVRSEKGRGTTVAVFFPASRRPALKAASAEPCVEVWDGTGTVLLIDDEEIIREVATEMLIMLGFEVLTAADGLEGLELFRRHGHQIALVILDMSMPGMSGDEVLPEIRRIRSDARVILSSGYSEQLAQEDFAGMDIAGFIQKPYSLQTLRQKIIEVLGGR